MNMSRDPKSGVIGVLCTAMTVQFAVGGSIVPFIALFLKDRGLSYSQISFIFTSVSAFLMVFPFFWGYLADRYVALNRLFTVLNLLLMTALMTLSWQRAFTGLLVCFIGFVVCFNACLTLINPLCFHHLGDHRGAFGLVRSWGSFGWMVPSLPVYFWLASNPNANLSCLLYLGMGFGGLMTAYSFWLPHTPPGAAHVMGESSQRLSYWAAMKRLLHNPNYLVLLVSFFLMSGSFSILIYYSAPQLERLGMPRAAIGPAQCVGLLWEIVLFRWQSLFVHRWSYAGTILAGCVCLALRQASFAWVGNLWVLTASYLLAAMVIVFFYTGASLLANALAGAEVRSTAQTLLVLAGSGLGPMCANFTAGWLMRDAKESLQPVFTLGAVLAGLAALLVLIRLHKLAHATTGGG